VFLLVTLGLLLAAAWTNRFFKSSTVTTKGE